MRRKRHRLFEFLSRQGRWLRWTLPIPILIALVFAQKTFYEWKIYNDAERDRFGDVRPSIFHGDAKDNGRRRISDAIVTLAGKFEKHVEAVSLATEKLDRIPVCRADETAGTGPFLEMGSTQWALVEAVFKLAKKDLSKWFRHVKGRFKSDEADTMEKRLGVLSIRPASLKDEADLTWRGTLVWKKSLTGVPELIAGSGFGALVEKNPVQAKFEMTRALAQSWTPCELAQHDVEGVWSGVLECFDFRNTESCSGSMSRAEVVDQSWAIVSTLASTTSNPGCLVQGMRSKRTINCLKRLSLPLLSTYQKSLSTFRKNKRKIASQESKEKSE